MVYDKPEPNELPPVAEAYQFKVDPADPVADIAAVAVPQTLAGVVVNTNGLFMYTVATFDNVDGQIPFVTFAR